MFVCVCSWERGCGGGRGGRGGYSLPFNQNQRQRVFETLKSKSATTAVPQPTAAPLQCAGTRRRSRPHSALPSPPYRSGFPLTNTLVIDPQKQHTHTQNTHTQHTHNTHSTQLSPPYRSGLSCRPENPERLVMSQKACIGAAISWKKGAVMKARKPCISLMLSNGRKALLLEQENPCLSLICRCL